MQKTYRNWKITAYKEQSLGGEKLLYYSLFDESDCEIASGFTSGEERTMDFIRLLANRIDEEIATRKLC